MKYELYGLILLTLAILAIPLYIAFILAASYGILFSINYFLTSYPDVSNYLNMAAFNIDILHIILTSILLAVIFKINSNSDKAIETLERSVSYDLAAISRFLEQIDMNTQNIDEIQNCITSLESSVDNLRD